jgi:hypothetical protein
MKAFVNKALKLGIGALEQSQKKNLERRLKKIQRTIKKVIIGFLFNANHNSYNLGLL